MAEANPRFDHVSKQKNVYFFKRMRKGNHRGLLESARLDQPCRKFMGHLNGKSQLFIRPLFPYAAYNNLT